MEDSACAACSDMHYCIECLAGLAHRLIGFSALQRARMRAQAYGLASPAYAFGGVLTGTAADYWNVLWPGASNGAAVGFLVASRASGDLRPRTVRRQLVHHAWDWSCGLRVRWSTNGKLEASCWQVL